MKMHGRIDAGLLSALGVAVGDTLVWDGARFKAGAAAGADGNHVGAGVRSVQVGPNAAATTERSTALGDGAIVNSGSTHSSAVGAGAIVRANCPFSVAEGNSAVVESDRGTAIGADAKVSTSSSYGVAIGVSSRAWWTQNVALGGLAEAGTSGAASGAATAVGYAAKATQGFATAVGAAATASGVESVVLGQGSTASASRAIVIGAGLTNAVSKRALIGAVDLELTSAPGALVTTSIILYDGTTATRQRLSINNGAVVIAAA